MFMTVPVQAAADFANFKRRVEQERQETKRWTDPMYVAMTAANLAFASASRFRLAQWLGKIGLRFFTGRDGWIRKLPGLGARWTMSRDLPAMPDQTFRQWWAERESRDGKVAK